MATSTAETRGENGAIRVHVILSGEEDDANRQRQREKMNSSRVFERREQSGGEIGSDLVAQVGAIEEARVVERRAAACCCRARAGGTEETREQQEVARRAVEVRRHAECRQLREVRRVQVQQDTQQVARRAACDSFELGRERLPKSRREHRRLLVARRCARPAAGGRGRRTLRLRVAPQPTLQVLHVLGCA